MRNTLERLERNTERWKERRQKKHLPSMKTFEDRLAPAYSPHLFEAVRKVCPRIFVLFFRKKNQNVVVYEANIVNGEFSSAAPVSAYWLILEPSYQQARRQQGIQHDREELNFLEQRLGFGFEAKVTAPTRCEFRFTNRPDDLIVLKLNPATGSVDAFTAIGDRKYRLESLFVIGSEYPHLFNLQDNIEKLEVNVIDITTKPYKRHVHRIV